MNCWYSVNLVQMMPQIFCTVCSSPCKTNTYRKNGWLWYIFWLWLTIFSPFLFSVPGIISIITIKVITSIIIIIIIIMASKKLLSLHFHHKSYHCHPLLLAQVFYPFSKSMLNRKMVFRVTKSQSMKDKLSFILYYMIIHQLSHP